MAGPDDAGALLAIYAPIVRDTVISFELEPPSIDEFRQRIERTLETHPWLVAEANGTVAGYSYATPFRSRPAYQWTAEVSVYVDSSHHRRGVGRALYAALFAVLELLGYRTVVAGIALPNPASVALHAQIGFKPVGVFERVGFKCGRWVDVGWWGMRIVDVENPPARPPTPLSQWPDPAAIRAAIVASQRA
jgi:L-amino acid N-acyltransferase YncA